MVISTFERIVDSEVDIRMLIDTLNFFGVSCCESIIQEQTDTNASICSLHQMLHYG